MKRNVLLSSTTRKKGSQIWFASNDALRKKINRLKIIKIWSVMNFSEEILNPSVRLSGILIGGVVIVYERKVKLLFDDVSRLLVEINEAWKITVLPDPTLLPKGKSQARLRIYEELKRSPEPPLSLPYRVILKGLLPYPDLREMVKEEFLELFPGMIHLKTCLTVQKIRK